MPTMLVALIYLAVLLLQLAAHDFDPSSFIQIGDEFVMQRSAIPPNVQPSADSPGYDGQFYYQIALNPFSVHWVNHGMSLDNGAYRNQRILYPLLAWAAAGGNPGRIPATMVLVNFLCPPALAWLGARYAQGLGHHALWGALFALFPGYLFTVTLDLTELVGATLLVAGVLTVSQGCPRLLTGLLLALAILARETSAVALIAFALAALQQRHNDAWPALAIPAAAALSWQAALWHKWDAAPALTAGLLLGPPGRGIGALLATIHSEDVAGRIAIFELAYLALLVAAGGWAVRKTTGRLAVKWMWAIFGVLLVCANSLVWVGDVSFLRLGYEFYLCGLMLQLAAAPRWPLRLSAAATLATWLLVCVGRLNW